MTRLHIGVGVAALILALTGAVYFTVPSSLEAKARAQVKDRTARAAALVQRNATLDAIFTTKQAERMATTHEDELVVALLVPKNSVDERYTLSEAVFAKIKGEREPGVPEPDVLAVFDANGEIALRQGERQPITDEWAKGHKLVAEVLGSSKVAGSKDIWRYRNQDYMKVGVAPLFQGDKPVGALLVGYVIDNKGAIAEASELDAQVAYFIEDRVRVSSLQNVDKATHDKLTEKLKSAGLMAKALASGRADQVVSISLGGQTYYATTVAIRNFEEKTSGAVIMVSQDAAIKPYGKVRLAIALLGLGALVIALLAIFLTARSVLGQSEEIELGVTEIINGNIDYVFKPVGADFDGLANALNVMMSRLTGRPEPGEEDEEGGGEMRPSVLLGEMEATTQQATTDPETLALAQESEPTYYARLFDEFSKAKKASGDSGGVSFEAFVAKLRVNELSLIKKYNCRQVRFRVVAAGGQVTLKPVPIF